MAKLLERTKIVYDSVIRKFIESGKSVEDYLFSLKGTRSYIQLNYYVLKRYCKENNIDFNIDIKDLPLPEPEISLYKQQKITKQDIIQVIHALKNSEYNTNKFFFAISTTYGTRCIELARITEKDIDLTKKLLLIKTAKSGEPRIYKIPDEILPYFQYFKPIPDQNTLWKIYHNSFKLAGINSKGTGYHTIRKILFTELINAGCPYEFVEYFFRWKLGGRVSFQHYFTPEIDRVYEQIAPKHPFIKEWKNE